MEFRTLQLKPSMETLGVVTDFLFRKQPFSQMRVEDFIAGVKLQVAEGCHVAVVGEGKLQAYVGWLWSERAAAQLWVRGTGPIGHNPKAIDQVAAHTHVAAVRPDALRRACSAARKLHGGKDVFFMRLYGRETQKPSRTKSFRL